MVDDFVDYIWWFWWLVVDDGMELKKDRHKINQFDRFTLIEKKNDEEENYLDS